MQSTITLHKIKRAIRTSALAFGFLSFFSLANAQTYENGPLSTGATSSNGVAAPAGTTWSEVQSPNTNAGFGANITAGLTLADNFRICGSWNLSKITFYAYSTGFTGVTSPFNDVRLRIYNTDPSVGSPTPIFGDLTTNRFLASSFANMYRIFNAAPGTTRKIWAVEATVNTTLPTGTYWLEWQLGNGGLSNFSPAVTIVGAATRPGFNAKQNALPNTWTNLVDGTPPGAQDMPFKIDYTTAACTGTPTPGNTIASTASACPGGAVSLSLQNCTPGSGVTYQWQSATAVGGPYTNITGATSSTYNTTVTATAFYQAVVTCGASSGTSTPVQVSLNPPSACYCVPGATNCTLNDEILNVSFGTLNNSSSGCSGAGYTDYTSTVAAATNVFIGVNNPMTVTIGPGGNDNVGVWIDYNSNGIFEASEFTLLGSAASGPITGNINVPSTVVAGTYRMRVRVKYATPVLNGTQACAAYTYGETEDYRVTVAPCVISTVTTQPPATKTISCSGTGTITATIAGSLNQYQWQVLATGAGAVWTDLTNNTTYSGVTTNTLTITNAFPTINGYQYRIRYQGACASPSVTSATTLTVGVLAPTVSNTLPINRCSTDAPTAISIATPTGLASLATTASGTLHTNIPDNNNHNLYKNDNFISNNINVTNIPAGASVTGFSVKLNVTHSWVGDLIFVLKAPNGKIISLDYALTGTGGAGPSTGFTNTIISSTGTAALSSGTNPYTGTFRLDNAGPGAPGTTPTGPVGFIPNTTVLADMNQGNGTWTLALYDYYQDDQTTNFLENWELNLAYTGQTTAVFTPSAGLFTDAAGTTAYTGQSVNTVYANPTATTTYTATVVTAICGSGTVSVPVNVGSPLTGTSTVANVSGCQGGSVTFTSTVPTGGLNATSQWQISTDAGVTWTNITGATSDSYTVNNVTTNMTGNRYRVVRTVASCTSTLTSSAGTLTVTVPPTLTISANPSTTLIPGQTTTLSVAVSPNAGASYQWFLDGVLIPGATASTYVVDIDGFGNYTVAVTDVNGCRGTSGAFAITGGSSENMFIYPSPNMGQFQIRFGNSLNLSRMVSIFDAKGTRVYTKTYSITQPFERLDVDLRNHGKGVYTVELSDHRGARIKTGRVVIF